MRAAAPNSVRAGLEEVTNGCSVHMKWPRGKGYIHMKRPRSGTVKHERSRKERKEPSGN